MEYVYIAFYIVLDVTNVVLVIILIRHVFTRNRIFLLQGFHSDHEHGQFESGKIIQ